MNVLCAESFRNAGFIAYINGNKADSWPDCHRLCGYCDYSEEAKYYFIRNGIAPNFFDSVQPCYHWICMFACEYHQSPNTISVYKLSSGAQYQPGKIVQHILNKCNRYKEKLNTALLAFRFVYLHCI